MIDSAQDLADLLAQFAVVATEIAHAHGCSVQPRLDSAGFLVLATLQGSN